MDKIAIKYDKHLTELAKSIFGNVVEKAYFSTDRCYSKSEIREELKRDKERISNDGSDICLDSNDIVIKFTSGRKVSFRTSEWGWIEPVNLDKCSEV